MILKRKEGMALPMVLVVLLLGSFLVYVTFEIVGNLFSSSRNVVEDVHLYNASIDGVEKGKVWLLQARLNDGRLPRWEASDQGGGLVSGDLGGIGDDWYNILIVRDLNDNPGDMDYSIGPVNVNVRVYDMGYAVGPNIDKDDYRPGFPPRIIFDFTTGVMSEHMSSTYSGSNRGEGSTGEGGEVDLGYYLIRSTASFEGRVKETEEAMILRL